MRKALGQIKTYAYGRTQRYRGRTTNHRMIKKLIKIKVTQIR